MEHLTFIFTLIAMTAVSGIIAPYASRIPLPWIQIFLGAVMAALGVTIHFDPSLFLALFIPPLLFADAWRIPKREIISLARPIISLATFLVVATIVGGGYFIHWMIPAISLGAAFVLASVLSPTDAVAVAAVTSQSKMPKKMHHLLEGESLFNDASGLVGFQVALAAMISGQFSIWSASVEFFAVALGGLAIGAGLALVFSQIVKILVIRHGEGLGESISLSIIAIPFASYLIAEHFHASGILSAVAGGMVLNYRSLYFRISGPSQLSMGPLWSVLAFSFNGIIFILLGSQIPDISRKGLRSAKVDFSMSTMHLIGSVLLVTAILLGIRFLWIWLGVFVEHKRKKGKIAQKIPLRLIGAGSIAGIRGAVTLAAVLSLPLTLPNGFPFPGRDLIIFIAAGVILATLLVGTFALPAILNGAKFVDANDHIAEEKMARSLTMRAAIEMLNNAEAGKVEDQQLYEEARSRLISIYQRRNEQYIEDGSVDGKSAARLDTYLRNLWASALKVEREEIYRLRKKRRISDEIMRILLDDLIAAENILIRRQRH